MISPVLADPRIRLILAEINASEDRTGLHTSVSIQRRRTVPKGLAFKVRISDDLVHEDGPQWSYQKIRDIPEDVEDLRFNPPFSTKLSRRPNPVEDL